MNIDAFKKIFPDGAIIEIDPGDAVLCDLCGEDYTARSDSGGFLFLSSGICPNCAPEFEKNIQEENEEKYIRKRCPEGKSFADWIRDEIRK